MAPKVPKKPLKFMEKIEKPISKTKKTKKKNYENYSIYIYKILKSVSENKNIGIGTKSMRIMNNFVTDMMENIANEAGQLCSHTKKSTLGSREIQTAVKLLIPGQLGLHAAVEGVKAVKNYHNSINKD